MGTAAKTELRARPWNKGKLLGQKPRMRPRIQGGIPRLSPQAVRGGLRGDRSAGSRRSRVANY